MFLSWRPILLKLPAPHKRLSRPDLKHFRYNTLIILKSSPPSSAEVKSERRSVLLCSLCACMTCNKDTFTLQWVEWYSLNASVVLCLVHRSRTVSKCCSVLLLQRDLIILDESLFFLVGRECSLHRRMLKSKSCSPSMLCTGYCVSCDTVCLKKRPTLEWRKKSCDIQHILNFRANNLFWKTVVLSRLYVCRITWL